jgi:uncharacterized coiled-coil DUF342 family protein
MLKNVLVVIAGLALALAAACGVGGDRDKANKMVDEANASITEGKKLFDDATSKFADAYRGTPDFEDRAKLEAPMTDAASKFDSAAGKMREAAQKMEDASKLNLEDWYKQYLAAFAERARKEADIAGAYATMAKDTFDASLADDDAREAKLTSGNKAIETLDRERAELQAKMDKIAEEHKSDFKK